MHVNKNIYMIIFLFLSLVIANNLELKVDFLSANPFSFKDIITDIENQEEQIVSGILKLPENNNKEKFPLIIGVAGSLGWRAHHYEFLEMYREMGIATFELKSFISRGVESTVGTQVEVTTAMMILDSYRALEILSNHPKIDKNNIAITGWSLGGGVSLLSAWMPLVDAIKPKNNFAAHLPIYPPCIAQPEDLDFSDSPIHILIGELDEWTPAAACQDLTSKLQNLNYNINITIYKNSHHSFDSLSPLRIAESGYSLTDCRFKIRSDGAVLMNFLDIPMVSPILQKVALAFCAERGPTFGGNIDSREKAFKFSKDFMSKYLLE